MDRLRAHRGPVARWIVPGEAPGGIIADIIVGIVGAVIGGWLYGLFGHAGVTGFNLPSMVCALIGAIVLLWMLRAIARQARRLKGAARPSKEAEPHGLHHHRPCIGTKDKSCVDVCPVDCIHGKDEDEMLYIDPEVCIDCGACVSACPVEAIFADSDVPEKWQNYTAINAEYFKK